MSRNVYFGDYFNVVFCSVGNDVAQVVVRIVLTTGQVRMAMYGYAPSLVISKMELQYIILVLGHLVDEELYVLNWQEMACGIKHKGTIGKAWLVVNDYGLYFAT